MKALITGATSGIGREMAKILAARGVDLIIASRDEQRMRHIAKRLPVAVRTIAVDLSKAEDCYRLYDAVKAEEIDILINNAGFGAYGATWDVPLETELNMLDLNVRAVQILTKLFLADFRKRGSGRILNVASAAGFLAGLLCDKGLCAAAERGHFRGAAAGGQSGDSDGSLSRTCGNEF